MSGVTEKVIAEAILAGFNLWVLNMNREQVLAEIEGMKARGLTADQWPAALGALADEKIAEARAIVENAKRLGN